MKKHELLAPAGGKAQLIAAINAGADAVYLGGENFNARVNANNFNTDEIKWALDFAHARGVKIYVTMNTLLSDAEFSGAFAYAEFLYEEGADALIVQDLGLAMQVKKYLPEIELHLSTQGTIYNVEGVKAAKELGFKRIVLARETTLDEIRELSDVFGADGGVTSSGGVVTGAGEDAKEGIEIETFIHGALCICYSGQCQMSRHIGGRSGNKGSCAQPCRLPYTSQYANQLNKTSYSLSPKDLCTVEFLGELCDAGVLSFKIEGRMKSPEYVAIVTSIYRKYLDLATSGQTYKVSQEDKYALNQIFNRGGFTSGYYHGMQSHKKFMSTDLPKHQGVYLGQVYERRDGSVFVDVDVLPGMSINLGDGIEIRSKELAGNIVTYRGNLKNGLLRIGDIKGKIENGDKVYKITDKSLMNEAKVFFAHDKDLRKSCIDVKFKAVYGEYPKLEVFESSKHVRVAGKVKVEKAKNTPTTKEMIIKQLSKTGGTPFEIADIEVEIEDGISIPIAELNKLRRDALAALELKKIKSTKRTLIEALNTETANTSNVNGKSNNISENCDALNKVEGNKPFGSSEISLFFHKGSDATPEFIKQKISELESNDINCNDIKIFVPLYDYIENNKNDTDQLLGNMTTDSADGIIKNSKHKLIPYILNISKGKLDNYIRKNFKQIVEKCKESGISIGNPGWIKEFSASGIYIYGDYGLNVTNAFAREALLHLGMGELASTSIEIHEGSFGKIPLMISEFIFEQEHLIDRKGVRYSIIKNEFGDKSIILSFDLPLDFDKIKKLQKNGENIRIYY